MIRMSSTERIPPPTVNGMNTFSAVLSTTSTIVLRLSLVAVISRNTSSSAPSRSYFSAKATGSPTSFNPTKLTPLTTLPSLTSRHGMILLLSMVLLPTGNCLLQIQCSTVNSLSCDCPIQIHLSKSFNMGKIGDTTTGDDIHRYIFL